MERLILGTAGHIDHGKTTLVRALTGVDTDRLPEEKRRGITVDIGFAALDLPDGTHFGVVDVPGHEAFVRNMLAGASGVDVALLVVAADEGVMPQTREHLAILALLDVRALVVALTKTDLVDPEWLELAVDDVRSVLDGTPWPDAAVLPVAGTTGAGLDALRDALAAGAQHARERRRDDLFRMPVDRVFTVHGTGTIVTGTVWSGSVQRDAHLRLLPSGSTVRVRGVQSHGMRWAHIQRGLAFGYGPDCVTLMSTPLYSNTTLVSFLPTLGLGGTLVIMSKFDAGKYLELAVEHRATHSMLVPVQYQRIMAREDFDTYDLSSFQMKFSTSAPFHAELKADILQRWPGGLLEFYGMTEGGGSCMLAAHTYPDKLATVGKPLDGHDMRVIDENGNELPPGEIGEVVGHSAAMMTAYLNKPEKTAEAEWYDSTGKRFIRTGDVGRFDEDGFLTLMDRRKDMIISGGFNIYPSDLEAELRKHPDLQEVTVIGVQSRSWGETPVGYAVLKPGATSTAEDILQWFNGRVGKTQRLNRLLLTDELPRSAIGKVLKRELRDSFQASFGELE